MKPKFVDMTLEIPAQMIKCTLSLHKSTYKACAFKKGHRYPVIKEEDDRIWMLDEMGHSFNFSKTGMFPEYDFRKYFK